LLRSLFVISLPRSLSTETYFFAQHALGLAAPAWTSDGEILNVDRYAMLPESAIDLGVKFTLKERDPERFAVLSDFLSLVAVPSGFAYKDVIHPFIVAEWLRQHPQYAVLRIKRSVPDVAFAMLAQGWFYPCGAAPGGMEQTDSIIWGLMLADRELEMVPGEHINFDDLITDERAVASALTRLYPGFQIPDFHFDENFRKVRDDVLRRRETQEYRELQHKHLLAQQSPAR
jgi:hypothetical protein